MHYAEAIRVFTYFATIGDQDPFSIQSNAYLDMLESCNIPDPDSKACRCVTLVGCRCTHGRASMVWHMCRTVRSCCTSSLWPHRTRWYARTAPRTAKQFSLRATSRMTSTVMRANRTTPVPLCALSFSKPSSAWDFRSACDTHSPPLMRTHNVGHAVGT